MIKCEVIFDEDCILVNNHSIDVLFVGGEYCVYIDGDHHLDMNQEQAIKYCMENQND